MLLEARKPPHWLRRRACRVGRLARGRRGRDRRRDRPQWRRQDDADHAIAGLLRCRRGELRFRRRRHDPRARPRLLQPRHRPWFPKAGACLPRCRSRRTSSSAAICPPPARGASRRWRRSTGCFRFCGTSAASRRPSCRVGSSRWWRSAGALMARPRIVLFDEPSLGLAPTIVDAMFEIIAAGARGRRRRPAGRAERVEGARRRRPRLCAGTGADRDHRPARRAF